jgi:hypothetical protein
MFAKRVVSSVASDFCLSEQKKTNSRVVDTNKRIDALCSKYDEEEYDENQNYDIDYNDDTGDEVPNHDNTSTTDSVSVEPPRKKQKSDATDDTTRFANMSKKFRLGENCDSPINEQLATMPHESKRVHRVIKQLV